MIIILVSLLTLHLSIAAWDNRTGPLVFLVCLAHQRDSFLRAQTLKT